MRLPNYASQAPWVALMISHAQSSLIPRTFDVGQQVVTTSGIIQGHAAANRTEVSEYLGIPYAQPPIGDLRFAAPEPFVSSAAFNASSFGLMCMATETPNNYSLLVDAGYNLTPWSAEYQDTIQGLGFTMGEDCLTLNVWTKPQVGEESKAVLLFIHGGGFQRGTSHNPYLTGQYFADEEDVVVISINYRTNVFGFPGLQPPVANVAPNAGLLDQRLAVEWARDNVAAFGGDPTRITLFGESAGSTSIDMYGYAYASDPIANGFITQSGTADSFDIPAPNSTAAFEALAVLLGCNTTTTTNTTTSSYSSSSSSAEKNLSAAAACIRAQPAEAVLAAMATIPATTSVLGTFAPTADNATVFSDYAARTAAAAAGSLAAVPRLHGSNADEGETFAINFALLGLVLPRAYWGWHTLAFFGCPTAASAAGHARAAGPDVPSWRYMYAADYPNVRLTVDPSLGAYHGAELNPLFGTSEALGGPDTPAEAATGSYMRAAWAAFAKDPHCGLSGGGFGWPVLPTGEGGDEDEAQIVVLGLGNATEAVFEASSVWDSACPSVMGVLQTIGGPAGLYALASLLQPALEGIEDGDINAVSKAILAVAQEVAGQ